MLFILFISLVSFGQDNFDIPDLDNLEDITSDDIQSSVDTSIEEEELYQLSGKLSNKIPDDQWESIKQSSNVTSSYTVQEGDWLFKISKKIFGTGHYYPKIWALNPYITNPNEIEPGMILVFNSSASVGPQLTLGGLQSPSNDAPSGVRKILKPKMSWEEEKNKLISQGVAVDYASDEMKDILDDSFKPPREDYKVYEPPSYDDITPKLEDEVSEGGISKDIGTAPKFKQGFSINTFITDPKFDESVGEITDAIKETAMILNHDRVYVKLDRGDMSAGDTFSVYQTYPYLISSQLSDRTGYKTVVHGHIKLIRRLQNNKWEAKVFGVIGSLRRGMKLMKYTPKMKRIQKRYASNQIESYVLGGYVRGQSSYTMGDIVYLDRGRNDGVRVGDVFGVFSRKDRLTDKRIQFDPTYMIGQLVIISLREEFATGLITTSSHIILPDSFAVTIPEGFKNGRVNFSRESGDDLDSISGIEDDEVAKALNTGDEDSELEDLEGALQGEDLGEESLGDTELEELEEIVDDSGIDDEEFEDEGLEDLEEVIESEEVDVGLEEELEELDEGTVVDDLEDLESIEEQNGAKYLDQNLNEKENPYGLTEGDLEEVDELLNIELDE